MLSEAIYRAQCHCNIHLLLHDRAGTSASQKYLHNIVHNLLANDGDPLMILQPK